MLQHLPEIVYKTLVDEHLSDLEVKTLRLVSKGCMFSIDTSITALKPRDFSSSQVLLMSLPYQTLCSLRTRYLHLGQSSLGPLNLKGQRPCRM